MSEERLSPAGEDAVVVGRPLGALGEEDGVAATLVSGEVVEGEADLFSCDLYLASSLPIPSGAFGAEGGVEGFAVHEDLEAAGAAFYLELRDPVHGAHEGVVGARFGEADRRRGVGHGLAEAVREHVRRAHEVDELRIEEPPAVLFEALSLDEHVLRGGGLQRGGEENGQCAETSTDGGDGAHGAPS